MLKFKKALSLVLAIAMSFMAVSVLAEPKYLSGDTTYYADDAVDSDGNTIVKVLKNAGDTASFEYDFKDSDVVYSDFVISFPTELAGVKLTLEALSPKHELSVNIASIAGSDGAYSDKVNMLSSYEQELVLDFTKFEKEQSYYIELSKPSIKEAKGKISVTVLDEPITASDGDEFAKLKKYEIMVGDENGNLNLDKGVTRAEMAQFIINLLCLKESAADYVGEQKFDDVPISHWANGAISLCHGLTIINGDGDGNFRPEDGVTHQEALKMIVMALGYEPMAAQRGGYPQGYIEVAMTFGITDTIVNLDAPALRGDIAKYIDKALVTPVMVQIGFGVATEYQILNGKDGAELLTFEMDHIEFQKDKDK